MKPPLVSVVVPFYNSSAFIAETIHSILAQTYIKFELILVNDGSTDTSREICESFHDPRIVIVDQANSGVSVARNHGLKLAKGRYVAFIDSDDLWHADKLAAHVELHEADPSIGVSYSNCQFISSDGTKLRSRYHPKLNDITAEDVFCRNPIAGGSSAFFLRDVFDHVVEPNSKDGLCDVFETEHTKGGSSSGEDHHCWMRIALHAPYRFQGIDRALSFYRIHDDGLSANIQGMYQGWRQLDKYVARVAPDLHKRVAGKANAFQLRYYARRLVAKGDGRQAANYMRMSLSHSLVPLVREPIKTTTTIAAILALLVMPRLSTKILHGTKQVRTVN